MILELFLTSVGGVMVSIDAFQALDPGSIPGHRIFFLYDFIFYAVLPMQYRLCIKIYKVSLIIQKLISLESIFEPLYFALTQN